MQNAILKTCRKTTTNIGVGAAVIHGLWERPLGRRPAVPTCGLGLQVQLVPRIANTCMNVECSEVVWTH